MDRWDPSEGSFPSTVPHSTADDFCPSTCEYPNPCSESSQRVVTEVGDSNVARKVQKADREKLRRDRLNEQFIELGNALDPDRPKNDKATILADTIQMLKDLTAQVNRLSAEYTSLSEESRELTLEKNELREEKATLKADIDSLNAQYQQRLRAMFPWATMDPSVMMGPPLAYPFPMPIPIPSGPIPVHPSLQPFPFFGNQRPAAVSNPCPTYLSYSSPYNPRFEQHSSQRVPSHPQPSSNRSRTSSRQETRSKSLDRQSREAEKDDISDVATELELKTPGSTFPSHSESANDQELSFDERKRERWQSHSNRSGATDGGSSSRFSSQCLEDSCSNSAGDESANN